MLNLKNYNNFNNISDKKAVGIVYHFTTPKNLIKILEEDRMASGHKHISFTRSFDLKNWYEDYGAYCRITFDGSGLSDRFRIEPYLFDPVKDPLFGGGSPATYKDRRIMYGIEREERIKAEEITGMCKYIIQVDILNTQVKYDSKNNIEALEKLGSEPFVSMGIPFNYVNKFEPMRIHI